MKVPAIFVINLDRSLDRLKSSESQLKDCGFKFERISAVDGKELVSDEIQKHYCKKKNNKEYHKELTRGEIGCYLSHRKVWQKIVDDKIEYAIILEDDFAIEGNINKTISTLNRIDFEWDYIKLATYKKRTRNIAFSQPINNMHLVLFNKAMAGTCAQAVSYSGAKKLLLNSAQFGRPIDIDLQYWWEKNIELFALLPYPFAPDLSLASDIAAMKPHDIKIKTKFWKRKLQQLDFIYRNNRERTQLIQKYK
ncbi:glycosyltransferase family 25 protein [Colwellia sp. RE-S-Sl-9]